MPHDRAARHFVFIVNPTSGRGRATETVSAVRAALRSAGHRVSIAVTTTAAGSATTLAAQAPDDARAVVAVGGDGTVREVAQGLMGRRVPLAVLPAGTENLAARHFEYPTAAEAVVDLLHTGKTRSVDVGRCREQVFLVVAGVGFDAEVVRRLSRRRRGHITYSDYVAPLWRTFWEHRFPALDITADGRRVFRGPALALVGNLPRYGLGLTILRRARDDDGRLDLCVFPCSNPATLTLHALRTACGRHLSSGNAVYRQARDIRISTTADAAVELDGDFAGTAPARFEIAPRALNLLLPDRQRT